MIDASTLITALVSGGLVASYLQISSERRALRSTRADLLRKLAAVESARWANLSDTEATESFRHAARELEVTAMVTGFSQEVVHLYLAWAQVASWESHEDLDRNPDPEYGGGISTDLAKIVTILAQLLSDSAWHPYSIRWTRRSRLKDIRAQIAELPATMRSAAKRTAWSRNSKK